MNAPDAIRFPSDDEAISVGYVRDLYELLRVIDEEMPKDATLYVEGGPVAREIRDFYDSHPARTPRDVERNTAGRKVKTFHLSLEETDLAELRSLAEHHAEPEICDHLVVYRDDRALLWAHDAGNGYVLLSRSLPQETIERIQNALATEQPQRVWTRLANALFLREK